jgi:hypothetical protein
MNAQTKTFSRKIASRPVRAALAIKIALVILGANVGFAAAKALFSKAPEQVAIRVAPSVDSAKPFIIPVKEEKATAKKTVLAQANSGECRAVTVETDEGYGVRGSVTRLVCKKAL